MKCLMTLMSAILLVAPSQSFGKSMGKSSPNGYASHVAELQGFVSKAMKISESPERTTFANRKDLANKLLMLTSSINSKLNSIELDTWAKKSQISPLRSRVADIRRLATQISGEMDDEAYEMQLFGINLALVDLSEGIGTMNIEIESSVFSNVDKYAITLEFNDGSHVLGRKMRDRLENFILEKSRQSGIGRLTFFVWSSTGQDAEIAGKRARAAEHFVRSFTALDNFKTVNMENEPTIWQWLVDKEKYLIKRAYLDHEFSDTREETIGWFLANAGGKSRLIVLYE